MIYIHRCASQRVTRYYLDVLYTTNLSITTASRSSNKMVRSSENIQQKQPFEDLPCSYRHTETSHDENLYTPRGALLSLFFQTTIVLSIQHHRVWSYVEHMSTVFGRKGGNLLIFYSFSNRLCLIYTLSFLGMGRYSRRVANNILKRVY